MNKWKISFKTHTLRIMKESSSTMMRMLKVSRGIFKNNNSKKDIYMKEHYIKAIRETFKLVVARKCKRVLFIQIKLQTQ